MASHPKPLPVENSNAENSIQVKSLSFSREEIENDDLFEKRFDEIAKEIAKDIYFTEFAPENRVKDFSEINEIFYEMAKAEDRRDMNAILRMELYKYAQDKDYLREDIDSAIDDFCNEIKNSAEEMDWAINLEDFDKYSLCENIVELCENEDDSEPIDVLSHCDKVEICFIFVPQKGYLSDYEICGARYCDYDEIEISQGFLETLPRLGYNLTEYRKHSGNKKKRTDPLSKYKKRSIPIVNLDDLKEIIENTGTSYFHIGIYAQVPLRDLIDIDFTKPIILNQYAICGINNNHGTFYDRLVKEPIIIKPEDGKWVGYKGDKGPDDWCGLSGSYYTAEISQ